MISVSVVLPIYNMEKYLDCSLQSLLNQSLKNIEVICVNDGSKDNSLSIIEKYKKIDPRIVLIDQENTGSGIARNNGIKVAKGEYIAFLDPDDKLYSKQALEDLYSNAILEDTEIAGGNFEFIYDNFDAKNLEEKNILEEEKISKEATNYVFKRNFVGNVDDYQSGSWFWRFIYKREFIINNNIFFPDYKRFQDIVFFAKALCMCKKIYFSKNKYYCYRINHKVMKYTKKQKYDILCALNDCFNIYYNYRKFVQYTNIFIIFNDMINVFYSDKIERELIPFIREILDNINFNVFTFELFEIDLTGIKYIISETNLNEKDK
jgi:glycosyltransferase involved in cell wall biosynthesis